MNIAESKAPPSFSSEPDSLRAMEQAAREIADEIGSALAPISRCAADLLATEQLSERGRLNLASIRRATDEVALTMERLREIHQPREAHARPADTLPNPGRRFPARRLRVLLIDDDPSLLESLRIALGDEGHKVTAASGGQAGIDAFRVAHGGGMPFDIVITDLAMPDVDGRQVVATLRELSPATPIIVLTGWQFQVTRDEQRALRVDRLLGKPPRVRELRAALAELTDRRVITRPG